MNKGGGGRAVLHMGVLLCCGGMWRAAMCSRLPAMPEKGGTTTHPTRTSIKAQALAGHAVEALLERYGVAERQRSKKVAEVLGLSYHAAHRRVIGDTPWTLEDLQAMAGHFGSSLSNLFQTVHDAQAVPATFISGTFQSPCRLWLGDVVDPDAATRLVAWQDGGAWMVGPGPTATSAALVATAVLIQPQPGDQPRLAVLDDDAGYVQVFKRAMVAQGYDVAVFTRPERVLEAARERPFDAYVVDWLLDDHVTAAPVCQALRALDAGALIILQSGQLTGLEVESELLRIALSLDLEPVVKPVRPSFLAAKIQRHMAQKWRCEERRAAPGADAQG